jgi:small-conductance mechanosensitive channel
MFDYQVKVDGLSTVFIAFKNPVSRGDFIEVTIDEINIKAEVANVCHSIEHSLITALSI